MTRDVAFPGTRENPDGVGRMNFWDCPDCGRVTVGVHADDPPGVVPFIFRCRATPGCSGQARSRFYPARIPDPPPLPHIEFFRPRTWNGCRKAIRKVRPKAARLWLVNHWKQGGSLVRELGTPTERHNAGIRGDVVRLRSLLGRGSLGDLERQEIESAITKLEAFLIPESGEGKPRGF